MNIVVLAGGLSTERDVSFQSGAMVANALRKRGHKALLLDVFMGWQDAETDVGDIFERAEETFVTVGAMSGEVPDIAAVRAARKDSSDCFFGPNVIAICRRADLVFLALHGEDGENGKIQAAFDLYGIRYTGNGYLGCALAMDKGLSKEFFRSRGIPTPDGFVLRRGQEIREPERFPCVVKPACGGSSIGVSIVHDSGAYQKALAEAFALEEYVVVEDFIEGREFSVGVMDGEALPVIEIAPVEGFYDYRNKYAAGRAVETCPADLAPDLAETMQGYAKEAAKALGLSAYSRMDFLLKEDGAMFCLEANTLPGMTPTSLLPQEAAAVGMSFEDLCEKIVALAADTKK